MRGRPLRLVVSNPPFNIVPHCVQAQFPSFGAGGEQGLDITRLFLWQALPHLEDNSEQPGEFLFYSQLAANERERFFLEDSFSGQGRHSWGYEVDIQLARFNQYIYDSNEYASIVMNILSHFPNPQNLPIPEYRLIREDLRHAGVETIWSSYGVIRRTANAQSPSSLSVSRAPSLHRLQYAFWRTPTLSQGEGGIVSTEQVIYLNGASLPRSEVPAEEPHYRDLASIVWRASPEDNENLPSAPSGPAPSIPLPSWPTDPAP